MADQKQVPPEGGEEFTDSEQRKQDFEFVLRNLLDAYQPLLEEELKKGKDPAELIKEAGKVPPDCDYEFALAQRIFERFLTYDVAIRMIPPEAREMLGDRERWAWCLRHLLCCLIFGWLVCRGPRNFRAFSYYLHRYWLCVRQVIGNPVSSPPTHEQQADLTTLIGELANAFRPYLTDQLATVEYHTGIAEEVVAGRIDCREGVEEICRIFQRLLTVRTAEALLGKAAFEQHSKDQFFWLCRCWCVCLMCFGCCLARARTQRERLWCLRYLFLCLKRCFGPPQCELTGPVGCVPEETSNELSIFYVPVFGTAAGAGFLNYALEWSSDDITYFATDFFYPPLPPGNAGPGATPVFGGLLAWFDTTFKSPGMYYIRMTVSAASGARSTCSTKFQVFKQDVRILGIDHHYAMDTGWTDPAAKFIETVPADCARTKSISEVSFGECLSVQGGAFVGGCSDRYIKTYMLDYKAGLETDCNAMGWTNFSKVDYVTPGQYRFINQRLGTSELVAYWADDCFIPNIAWVCAPFRKVLPQSLLTGTCWGSHIGTCQLNGLYTFRLVVIDNMGTTYCDTQSLWIDNKRPCGSIRIDAVPRCGDLNISMFAHPPTCDGAWPLPLSGISYDAYIDEARPFTRPNDNFDYYEIKVEKQGGPEIQLPIPGPGFDPKKPCFHGVNRVGDPIDHCLDYGCDPNNLDPAAVFGTLAWFDLRALDPLCSGSVDWGPIPARFTIPRGECCVYIFKVWVYDRTIRWDGQHNVWGYGDWPVKICNDLPPA